MTDRERDEKELHAIFYGKHVQVTAVTGGIFFGMCNEVALWDGRVILHVANRRFEFDYDCITEHVKLQTNGDAT